jgi:hypothetical protein
MARWDLTVEERRGLGNPGRVENRTIHRLFDGGGLLVVENESSLGAPGEQIALGTSYCMSPECTCREINVRAWRVEGLPEGASEPAPRAVLSGRLDLDSGALMIPPDALGHPPAAPELLDLVRRALRPGVLDLLRERWHRVKGLERADEWRTVDWSRIELDALVPFLELFPSRWDLSVIMDHQRYWAVDSWCLAPRCTCQEIAVEFIADRTGSVGAIRIDVGRSSVVDVLGQDARLRPLGERLLGDSSIREDLRARRKLIRRVSRELPRFLSSPCEGPAASTPTPSRNGPCPCGSGKKYKRCCGR